MERKLIYLLEDDAGIKEMLTYLLTTYGYYLKSFGTVKELKKGLLSNRPDLFILDVTLPDGSGLIVSSELSADATCKSIPVLLMSANQLNESMATNAGASAFIAKPFDIDAMLNQVKSLLVA